MKIVETMVQIEGLPADVEITDPQLLSIMNSPRYKVTASKDGDDYQLLITPANTDGMELYRQKASYGREIHIHFDPTKSKLVPYDDDPEIAHGRMVAAHLDDQHINGYSRDIEALDGAVMYRGISTEEWASIVKTGTIQSNGSGNLGSEQVGLTYWTTDLRSALSYAHGFASMNDKAAPGFPAYIIAAPLSTDTKHVPGVGDHEVGVTKPIRRDQLLAVWAGHVWSFQSTDTLMRQHWDGTWKTGGISHPTARLEWKRIL